MPETYVETINRLFRDHMGGDPSTYPIGDPSTRQKPVSKRDIREAFLLPGVSVQGAIDAAAAAQAAADAAVDALEGVVAATFWFADQAALLANSEVSFPTGTYFATRAEMYSYVVVDPGATDHHLETSGGVKVRVSPHTRTLYPEMFGAYGVVSVGDLAIVGTSGIPDEAAEFQAMFDFAILHGCKIIMGRTNRDYGIGSTINLIPQENREKGNINAVADNNAELALHHSNTPSLMIENPGNSRLVALAPMQRMFRIYNPSPTEIISTPPYWATWNGVNAHGFGNASVFIETEWSYRNSYIKNKVIGFEHGWQCKQDAGSHWGFNDINCTESAIWLDNAGDCSVEGGDISVQKDGIRHGGGNNNKIIGVTFTGNVFAEAEMVAVRLFGGSSVTANPRTRGITVLGCEFAGVDWGIRGNDNDVDGFKEMWSVNAVANKAVRNLFRPNVGLIWIRNGANIHLSGNMHGDHANAIGPVGSKSSIYLENVEGFVIDDMFTRTAGSAIHLKGCQGGTIRSQFSDCGLNEAEGIVLLEDSTEVIISGNSVRWRAASPAATKFVVESGTSNRNVAGLNAIDRTKMADPYLVIGAASSMS